MDSIDKEKHMRDAVFNTINLINDLESDDSQNSSSQSARRSPKEDVVLSERFVSGIKDKLVDPTKLQSQNTSNDNSNFLIEKHKEEVKSYMEANFMKLRDVIQSQHSEMQSLKQEIASMKSKIASLDLSKLASSNPNDSPNHGVNRDVDYSSNENSSNSDSTFIGSESTQTSPSSGFISESNGGQQSLNSNFESSQVSNANNPMSNSNFQANQQQMVNERPHQSQPAHQPAYQQEPQPVAQQAKPQEAANPRVGNYQSSDVLIEKYFYYGNKK